MTNLKGSEKQIAWAEKIRESYKAKAERFFELAEIKEFANEKEKSSIQREKIGLENLVFITFEEDNLQRGRNFNNLKEMKKKEFQEEFGVGRDQLKDMDREERTALRNEAKPKVEAKMTEWLQSRVEKVLEQEDASFWIDRLKHLS